MSDITRIKERINFCIQGELWEQLPRFLNELHPADIAEIINHASIGDQNTLFDLIDQDIKPDVLAELDHQAEADVLEELTDEEISDLVEEMAPDDAADLRPGPALPGPASPGLRRSPPRARARWIDRCCRSRHLL